MEKYPRNKNGEEVRDSSQRTYDEMFSDYVKDMYKYEARAFLDAIKTAQKNGEPAPILPEIMEPATRKESKGRLVTLYKIADAIIKETLYPDGSMNTLVTEQSGDSLLLSWLPSGATRTKIINSDGEQIVYRDKNGKVREQ